GRHAAGPWPPARRRRRRRRSDGRRRRRTRAAGRPGTIAWFAVYGSLATPSNEAFLTSIQAKAVLLGLLALVALAFAVAWLRQLRSGGGREGGTEAGAPGGGDAT